MTRQSCLALPILTIALVVLSTGCKKKVPAPVPPPAPQAEVQPPTPKPPVIHLFAAVPDTIEQGHSAELRWTVSDATELSIDQGIGAVTLRGSRRVSPTAPITYTLQAKGPGGTVSAAAPIHVTMPLLPPPPPIGPAATLSERLAREVEDAFFDFDRSTLREDARITLTRNAAALKLILSEIPTGVVVVEGHCDERGSAEYNLALGDRRAASAREYLDQLGVPDSRLTVVSYGTEKPQCGESNEPCWQRNRRVHFRAGGEQPGKTILGSVRDEW